MDRLCSLCSPIPFLYAAVTKPSEYRTCEHPKLIIVVAFSLSMVAVSSLLEWEVQSRSGNFECLFTLGCKWCLGHWPSGMRCLRLGASRRLIEALFGSASYSVRELRRWSRGVCCFLFLCVKAKHSGYGLCCGVWR